MLQQTQVATVRDRFYFPFLKKFPTISALAAANQAEVMKAWEGLGYYSRARNLHAAAKKIVNSEWWMVDGSAKPTKPLTIHQSLLSNLLSLPGIGKNTAHAILAFAYHQPVAILEANVKRVVARIFALRTPNDGELWAGAEMLLNPAQSFDYNQAMMDLGALVCTPKNPQCAACPARGVCKGRAAPETYPAKKVKKTVPVREVFIHVREDGSERLLLEKRDEKLLGGLYGFAQSPHTPIAQGREHTATIIGRVTHAYSHFKVIGHVAYERVGQRSNSADWYSRAQIKRLPLSRLDHKVLALVDNCHTARKKK